MSYNLSVRNNLGVTPRSLCDEDSISAIDDSTRNFGAILRRDYELTTQKVGEDEINRLELLMKDNHYQWSSSHVQVCDAFQCFTDDTSLKIPVDRFAGALEFLGFQFSDVQIKALFGRYDVNCEGEIDYVDFINTAMFYVAVEPDFGQHSAKTTGKHKHDANEASVSAVPYFRRMGLSEKEIDEIDMACMVETTEAEQCNMIDLKGISLDCRDVSSIAACVQTISECMLSATALAAIDAIVTASTASLLPDSKSGGATVMLLASAPLPRSVEDEARRLCVAYSGRSVASSPRDVFYEFERGEYLNGVLGCLYQKRDHIDWVSIATSQFLIVCTQTEANVSTSIDSCAKYVVYATTPIKTLIEWVPGGVLAEEM